MPGGTRLNLSLSTSDGAIPMAGVDRLSAKHLVFSALAWLVDPTLHTAPGLHLKITAASPPLLPADDALVEVIVAPCTNWWV